ncbi:MAG: hypothetical protein PHE56_15270 [Bacteroidales bacterium]|mgnify:CR=1 FL=1|jgi:hypothetical protein|nr:hypothetical protein [Bacteroidales bacterium]
MKRLITLFLIYCSTFTFAQYQVGLGFFFNTVSPLKTGEFASSGTNSIDFSIKMTLPDYQCWDIIAGKSKDYFQFSIMKEVHRQMFYPVDFYIGLGIYAGVWNKNYLIFNPTSKYFGGLDGSVGLQFTLLPISFSVGWRPVWSFLGADSFIWVKQVGIRYSY